VESKSATGAMSTLGRSRRSASQQTPIVEELPGSRLINKLCKGIGDYKKVNLLDFEDD
jgi:hypothetical protein